MKLCKSCTECIQGRRSGRKEDTSQHHASLKEFKAAVKIGCDFCSHLVANLSDIQRQELLNNMEDPTATSGFSFFLVETPKKDSYAGHPESFRVHIMLYPEITDRLQDLGRRTQTSSLLPNLFLELQPAKCKSEHIDILSLLLIALEVYSASNIASINETRPLLSSHTTSSDESWTTVRRWMDNCLQAHRSCSVLGTRIYPTRLIVIDRKDDQLHLRLAINSEDALEGPYATLSHCWGKLPILTLLRSNYERMRRVIPFDQLPKTFQEAVEVVFKLGIHLLWIDSLCIMQDPHDLSDWHHESRRMQTYYGNAIVNIAATASSDGSQGLYRERDPERLRHLQLWLPTVQGRASGLYDIVNLSHWDRSLGEAVLNTRAWVLQERLLARRVLHFGQDQLLWECQELTASEMYPHGLPNFEALAERNLFKDLIPDSPWNKLRHPGSTDSQITYFLWENVKNEYAKCHLTSANDKELAMAGIADHFTGLLGDKCIFGMWRQQLLHQLLWRVSSVLYPSTHELTTEKRQFPVPSFSWLSVNCPLDDNIRGWMLKKMNSDLLAEILTIEKRNSGQGKSATGTTPILRLAGSSTRFRLVLGSHGLVSAYICGAILEQSLESSSVYLDRTEAALEGAKDEMDAVFLPIRLSSTNSWRDKETTLEGLLLEQVVDQETDYRRIGYMEIRSLRDIKRIARKDINLSSTMSKRSKARTQQTRAPICIV